MRYSRFLLTALLTAFALSGCSFAYYNTLFNAKHYYKQAQKVAVRDDGRPAASAVQDYNKVIQKCGIIITEYKETKWVDDALFLLAKSLYYKGGGYVQAAEKFEDLLKYYPDSEFVPESKLYLARCRRALNKPDEAYRIVQDFLVNKDNNEYHPEALLMMANWRIEDEDFIRAEALLNQLLEEFPESTEYEQAYFLLGLTYQNQGDWARSSEVFQQLIDTKAARRTRMDARYHIAENLHAQGDYEASLQMCETLEKDEYKETLLPRIQLLKARDLAGLGQLDDAIAMLEKVMADAAHTYVSAEAAYWLAEIYFTVTLDYEQAIEYYNRVKREKNDSEYVESALTRSAVASQILQFQDTERDISAQDLINEQFKLAEYYLDVLAMPDSALSVYGRVQIQERQVEAQAALLDSLLQAELARYPLADTLSSEDSLAAQARLDSLQTAADISRETATMYAGEFSPFSRFCELWVNAVVLSDSVAAQGILDDMRQRYPGNRYTVGAEDFLAGRDVSFVTLRQQRAATAYSDAVDLIDSDPERAALRLSALLDDYYDEVGEQTLYSLGWVNLFELGDSVAAAQWFDSLLVVAPESDYADYIEQFYADGAFITLDELPSLADFDDEELGADEPENEEPVEPRVSPTVKYHGPMPVTPLDAVYEVAPGVVTYKDVPNNTGKVIVGEVLLNVEILADGSVGAVSILRSYDSSPGGLDELALETIRKWRFTPATIKDEPVSCWLEIPLHYGPLELDE